ncbi:helix-turn-helix domain-containing protein [Janibacter indicus]
MTVTEVAEELRLPVSTVRFWRAQGRGPHFFKVGRRLVCRRSDFEAFVEQLASA